MKLLAVFKILVVFGDFSMGTIMPMRKIDFYFERLDSKNPMGFKNSVVVSGTFEQREHGRSLYDSQNKILSNTALN